jgi:glycopeptide antibiotics resistance protein
MKNSCPIVKFWKTILALIVILFLCLMPAKEVTKLDFLKLTYEDKAVHLLMFAGFAAALYLDFIKYARTKSRLWRFKWTVFSLSVLLGISTELMQYFFAALHRDASLADFAFDVSGAILGLSVISFIKQSPDPSF